MWHALRRGKADDCFAVRRAAAALCATPRSTLVSPVPRPVHGHTLRLPRLPPCSWALRGRPPWRVGRGLAF
jgi:hypothetical protein